MKLLHIDSSALGAGSASRSLTADIVARQVNGADGPEGLLTSAKKVFIASSRGNVYAPGLPSAPFDHHESYLTSVLNFVGLTDVTVVRAEGLAFGPEARQAAIGKAREQIAAIAA
jgi:FMN-dependent NADH-azoreductase